MTGQIIADASKLYELDDGLRNTTSQLDSVIAENEELIRDTKNQITDILDIWKRRQEASYEKLLAAQEALARAEAMVQNSEDGRVPPYFYQAVSMCQAEYDDISGVCAEIERVHNDFEMSVSLYKSTMDSSRQDYVSILQKSSHILTQYAEFVRKSSSITSGGTGIKGTSIICAGAGEGEALATGTANSSHSLGISSNAYELTVTNEIWTTNTDGSMVFNTPVETGEKLDSCQGKVNGFLGTCGLVSCVNVLRLAGYPASESEVVGYASTTSMGFGRGRGRLCTTNKFPEENGGTSAKSRQQILNHFGIRSELRDANVANIAYAVSEGRGVIISVYAGMLYNGWSNHRDLHAITVTSVKKDRYGNVLGFYVCDSGTGGIDNSKFYTTFQIENALSGRQMNVTSIIR